MNNEKIKICDLEISDRDKKALSFLLRPQFIADLTKVLNVRYNTVSQILREWCARKWVRKIFLSKGRVKYRLNTKILEP